MARDKVFISYSHKDERWMTRLLNHLRVFEMEGLLGLWVDKQIKGGEEWYKLLNMAMLDARVAVLLISNNFLTSQFIRKDEVPRLFDCHCDDGMRIVPVIILPCTWERTWVADMQVLPENGKPLADSNRIKAERNLVKVAYEILDIYETWDRSIHHRELCSEKRKTKNLD